MKSISTFSILTAGMAFLPLLALGADTCVHESEDRAAMLREDAVSAVESPESARSPGSVELVCQQNSISRINVILPAGERRGLVLVAGSRDGQPLQPRLADTEGWARLVIEESSDGSAIRLNVEIVAPEAGTKGEKRSGSLLLFSTPNQRGEPLITIPLELTIDEEQPLFRDQFDVDPVIGQFSLVM